jgi:hypothetical protein
MTVFKRNADAPQEDSKVCMPSDGLNARVVTLCVSEVLGRFERFTLGDEGPEMYPWATRFVMGFPLPSWQRPLVWSPEQKIRFIRSIWMGVDIGSYMVNDRYEFEARGAETCFREFSEVLLDGQQRLATIEEYVLNKLLVPDTAGVPRSWSELPLKERRRFGGVHFARANIQSWDEAELRMAYDLRAFGGTAHTEDQRALPAS